MEKRLNTIAKNRFHRQYNHVNALNEFLVRKFNHYTLTYYQFALRNHFFVLINIQERAPAGHKRSLSMGSDIYITGIVFSKII